LKLLTRSRKKDHVFPLSADEETLSQKRQQRLELRWGNEASKQISVSGTWGVRVLWDEVGHAQAASNTRWLSRSTKSGGKEIITGERELPRKHPRAAFKAKWPNKVLQRVWDSSSTRGCREKSIAPGAAYYVGSKKPTIPKRRNKTFELRRKVEKTWCVAIE